MLGKIIITRITTLTKNNNLKKLNKIYHDESYENNNNYRYNQPNNLNNQLTNQS